MIAANNIAEQTDFNVITPVLLQRSLSNGSEFTALKSSMPGLIKVMFCFKNPVAFSENPFLAEMTFQLMKSGTENRNTFQFITELEQTGVMLSNYVNSDCGFVEFVVLEDQLETVMFLILEMLLRPAFPQDEFERIKTVGVQNWKVSRRQTHAVARESFMNRIFPDHPYGTVLTEESLLGLALEDVKTFHQSFVLKGTPSCYISAFDPEHVFAIVDNEFHKNQAFLSPDTIPPVSDTLLINKSTKGSTTQIPLENTVQSSIRIGRQLFTRSHKDFIAGKVTATILGGYFSSRLMANLREDKGYTYGVGAGVITKTMNGFLSVSADVGNLHLHQAVDEIMKEIGRLRSEKVDDDELQTVKQYLSGSMIRELDGAFSQLSLIATLDRQGLGAEWINLYMEKLDQITPDDIAEFSVKYLQDKDLVKVVCGEIG